MRKVAITTAITCLVWIGGAGSGFAQHGIPTFDTNAVARMMDQIKQGAEQIKQLEAQLRKMGELHASLNGLTDGASIQELLKKDSVAKALPDNYADYQKMIKGGGGGKAGGYARTYREENEVKLSSTGHEVRQEVEEFYQNALESQKDQNAEAAGTGHAIYEAAVETAKKIEEIATKLESAETPKEVQDYQAQLVALQAKIQTDMLKMQALVMAQDAQYKTLETRKEELRRQQLGKLKEYYKSKSRSPK